MLILGIDPGSRHTGFGVIRCGRGNRLAAIEYGRLSVDPRAPLATRLGLLAQDLEELLTSLAPQVVAIESTFLGMNPRSLVVLSQARGAILGVLGRLEVEVLEYSPAEVKSAVTGNGRADKQQVARMVGMLLSLAEGTMPEDASDALAVAICCARKRDLELLARGPRP